MPAGRYISQLPDYASFGRQTKLWLNPQNIPDLSWEWADTVHTQDIGRVTVSHIFHLDDLLTHDSLETILVNTNVYTQAMPDPCTTINACKFIVSSSEKSCPIDRKAYIHAMDEFLLSKIRVKTLSLSIHNE